MSSPARPNPPPTAITSGTNTFTMLTSPSPRMRPMPASASTARPSPSRPASTSSRPSRSPSSRATRSAALPEASVSRCPRPGQPAPHGGPFTSTTMCPSSAPAPRAPRYGMTVQDQAAADARAEREHHEVPRPPPGAELPLRDGGDVAVVVDEHREVRGAPRGTPPDRCPQAARARSRSPGARPGRSATERRRRPPRRAPGSCRTASSRASRNACCDPCGVGRSSAAASDPSSETSPEAIFVPPTSMPITGRDSKGGG